MLAASLAALFAVVSAFLAVVASGLNDDLDRERADRADVLRVAGEFSAALLTYDHERLDEPGSGSWPARPAGSAVSTKAFAGLSELIRTTRSRATATVKDVFVGQLDDEAARVITVVDADIKGTAGQREAPDSYVLLDLVKVDGTWKVDGVTSLNFNRPGVAEPPGAPEGGGDSQGGTEE